MANIQTGTAEKFRKLVVELYSLSKRKEKVTLTTLIKKMGLSTRVSAALRESKDFTIGPNRDGGSLITWNEKVPADYGGQMYFLALSKKLHASATRKGREKVKGLSYKTQQTGEDIKLNKKHLNSNPDTKTIMEDCDSPRANKIKESWKHIRESLEGIEITETVPVSIPREIEIKPTEPTQGVSLESSPDDIVLRLNKKTARVLLLLLEENNEEIYKKFTENLSAQIFDLVF